MFSGYGPFIPVLHLYHVVLYVLFVSNMFHFLPICICIVCVYAGFVTGTCAVEPAA
jgi:hypothetical protein